MKIGNCNLPDKANVLGTEYKIYYDTKENNPKMEGSQGYIELCSKPCQPHELGTLTITYKDIGKTEKHLVCLECGKKISKEE